jgi:hypothetical protein
MHEFHHGLISFLQSSICNVQNSFHKGLLYFDMVALNVHLFDLLDSNSVFFNILPAFPDERLVILDCLLQSLVPLLFLMKLSLISYQTSIDFLQPRLRLYELFRNLRMQNVFQLFVLPIDHLGVSQQFFLLDQSRFTFWPDIENLSNSFDKFNVHINKKSQMNQSR